MYNLSAAVIALLSDWARMVEPTDQGPTLLHGIGKTMHGKL